jgi:Flp pilus assembly protein CpaB
MVPLPWDSWAVVVGQRNRDSWPRPPRHRGERPAVHEGGVGSPFAARLSRKATMDIEYRDDGHRRGKYIVVIGVILALVAGGGAFFVVNQAQQQAGQASQPLTQAVVAVAVIAARQPIKPSDVTTRQVALDPANANGVATDVSQVVGRVPAVTILQGQIVTTNMLASTTEGSKFSILRPDETIAPDSEAWRAVSITVPDDLAVGGLLVVGQSVDVFVTTVVNVPPNLAETGKYVSERSTKVTYQDVPILARADAFYVIRVSLPVAEEIAHLQASGATFSLALRPDSDTRSANTSGLGETTNRIIEKYGIPIPEPIDARGTSALPVPTPGATPVPSSSVVP